MFKDTLCRKITYHLINNSVRHDAIDFVNGLGDVSMMLRLVPNDALHSEMTLF